MVLRSDVEAGVLRLRPNQLPRSAAFLRPVRIPEAFRTKPLGTPVTCRPGRHAYCFPGDAISPIRWPDNLLPGRSGHGGFPGVCLYGRYSIHETWLVFFLV